MRPRRVHADDSDGDDASSGKQRGSGNKGPTMHVVPLIFCISFLTTFLGSCGTSSTSAYTPTRGVDGERTRALKALNTLNLVQDKLVATRRTQYRQTVCIPASSGGLSKTGLLDVSFIKYRRHMKDFDVAGRTWW